MTGPQRSGNMCRALQMLKRSRLSAPMWPLIRLLSSGHSVCRFTVELSHKGRGTRCLICLHAPSSTGSLSPSGSVALPKISGVHRDNWSYPWHKSLTLPTRDCEDSRGHYLIRKPETPIFCWLIHLLGQTTDPTISHYQDSFSSNWP
jgi:hypothetical protein